MPRKSSTAVIPADESKRAKFIRLANARITKAYNSVRLIGNLSGAGYEYTPEDIEHIRKVLSGITDTTLAKFDRTRPDKPDVPLLAA